MSFPLAVFAPDLGAPFTRRHMQDLLPARTAVVASSSNPTAVPMDWKLECPFFDLTNILGGRLRWHVLHGLARQFHVQLDRVLLQRFLRRSGVRVVMGEYLDFSLQWLETLQELGIRFFAHAHGDDVLINLREPKWQREYLRYCEAGGIISNSYAVRKALVDSGLPLHKIEVVYCGVDVPPQSLEREERTEIRCVAVGRAVPQKAPILLLDAFRRAVEECRRLRLDFIGAGPLIPAVHEFIRAFGLGDNVILHGTQRHSATLELIEKADIFIQHSMWEGLGVAVLEAMACSLPVVATSTGGILETVVDGSTGYLVEPGDSAGMAERIICLARDADLRRRMGLAGWQRARDCFTWERERAELLRILGLQHESRAA